MKHYYFATLWLFCHFQAEIVHAQNFASLCGSNYWREIALQDPDFFQKNEAFEQAILKVFKQKKPTTGLPEQTKVLPTVVHIIHDGGPENISDAQVQQAIQWLNQALANQGSFNQGSGADCAIQLCLAQRTPDGLPTNGITRNQSLLTEMKMEIQDVAVKNLDRWQPLDYLNIWLVRSICSDNFGCEVYGYANYPFAHGSIIDGIVIEASYLTEISKISGLAHEVGHYLGLYHTFEGGCINNNCLLDGDRICDTPPDQSTAGMPCGQTVNSCSTDTQSGSFTTDQTDMTWNFMDYGMLACFHDYTFDQAIRMNTSLNGARQSLLDSKGCFPPCTDHLNFFVCPNTLYNYKGTFLPADTVAIFHLIGSQACDSVISVTVQAFPPINLSLAIDTTVQLGATVSLHPDISGTEPLYIEWSPVIGLDCFLCQDPIAYPLETSTYEIMVTDKYGCKAIDSVTLTISEVCPVLIPNAFTPNNDGSNDVFRPISDPCVDTVRLWKILNRWGQTVFEQVNLPATDPNLGWDGNWKGKPQPPDLLIWMAEFEFFDGRRESKSGQVSLIR